MNTPRSSTGIRRPELIRFAKIDSSFLRPILSFTENLSAGRWGEGGIRWCNSFPLNFSHRGYFPRKQRSTDPLSLFPLPNKNQLHKQAMEKGCLQRKLHFHGSRITHKRRREHATGEIPAYSNISCIKEYKGNKRFQVNNLWQSVHRYYSPKDIPRNFFFFRACVAEKCSRHLLRSINVVPRIISILYSSE